MKQKSILLAFCLMGLVVAVAVGVGALLLETDQDDDRTVRGELRRPGEFPIAQLVGRRLERDRLAGSPEGHPLGLDAADQAKEQGNCQDMDSFHLTADPQG